MTATTPLTIVFAGSFQDYSGYVLSALLADPRLKISGVLTTPPHPQGRQKILTPSPVAQIAATAQLPTFTPEQLNESTLETLTEQLGGPPDLLLTAGYGKLVPPTWLAWPTQAALNLHFSLLPKYRGANPAEWGLLAGETEFGVTLMTMSETFDTGAVLAQATCSFSTTETRLTAYEKLYRLGATHIADWVWAFGQHQLAPQPQPTLSPTPAATRFDRNDGRVEWSVVAAALAAEPLPVAGLSLKLQRIRDWTNQPSAAVFLDRATRALQGFPGLWTEIPTTKGVKRLKILATSVLNQTQLSLDQVQLEGYQPASWSQLQNLVSL
jgi:methionyl-tRNA formyltransferase